jgi:hypothetical protein
VLAFDVTKSGQEPNVGTKARCYRAKHVMFSGSYRYASRGGKNYLLGLLFLRYFGVSANLLYGFEQFILQSVQSGLIKVQQSRHSPLHPVEKIHSGLSSRTTLQSMVLTPSLCLFTVMPTCHAAASFAARAKGNTGDDPNGPPVLQPSSACPLAPTCAVPLLGETPTPYPPVKLLRGKPTSNHTRLHFRRSPPGLSGIDN